jgi:hypothetical protein
MKFTYLLIGFLHFMLPQSIVTAGALECFLSSSAATAPQRRLLVLKSLLNLQDKGTLSLT